MTRHHRQSDSHAQGDSQTQGDPRPDQRRRDARIILDAAIAAADPTQCLLNAVELAGDALVVEGHAHPLTPRSRIRIIGAGKATPAMASAMEQILGDRVDRGSINTKYGHTLPLRLIHTIECGHPIPDQAGVEGAHRILSELEGLTADDIVICLLSGGGSALLPAPAAGLSLADKQDTTASLLACGASIDQINTIRKHLSALKGGQLARHAAPARLITLAISDVIGDPPETIASGPTVGDPTTFDDCLKVVDEYGLRRSIPSAVLAHLEAGVRGEIADTPLPDAPELANCWYHVVGNNTLSLEAARKASVDCGYEPLVLSSRIAGETKDVACMHAAIAMQIVDSGQPLAAPACLISGGETTVTLSPSAGVGGRNQEFALAAAIELMGESRITVLSAGTDGTDGPTDAAGAIADGSTVERARQAGYSAAEHLRGNNAYPFFAAIDDLIRTGPTGTNVMDLRLFLVD